MEKNIAEILPGDKVRVVAPAGAGRDENLPKIRQYIESLGLVATITENIYDPSEPFYSNTDEFRAADLIDALTDPETKVIWCIRGGSGSMRLIEEMEDQLPRSLPPKFLIGFSDITTLILYFDNKFSWQTMHGGMLESIVNGSYDPEGEPVKTLERFIFNTQKEIIFDNVKRIDSRAPFESMITSIIGGNLTVVEVGIKTIWEIDGRDKIIFLEDVGEAPYRLERSLDHMKQANIFEQVKAVLFGDFTGSDPELTNFVFERFANSVAFPVFRVKNIGHDTVNFPLPMNTLSVLRLVDAPSKTYSLTVTNIVQP